MKILLLAGEESGLIYARALAARLPNATIRGYQDYGFQTSDLAVMGFAAVVRNIFFFLRVKRTMEHAIDVWRPDVVCTIDYPGLNLKLAAYAKSRGIRTVHIVCPQVWAWKQGRIPKIERALDHLCCFFPFEPRLFKSGFATFVGHPLLADFNASCADVSVAKPTSREERIVALLPGSRRGEITRILPTLLDAVPHIDAQHFIIPAANEGAFKLIESILKAQTIEGKEIKVRLGGAREVLRAATCAAVASGTATLEAALANCPTVLVYRVSPLLAAFARLVIRGTKYIGLANIIWDRSVEKTAADATPPMPELLQEAFTSQAVAEKLNAWLENPEALSAAELNLKTTVATLQISSDPISLILQTLQIS